MRVLVVGTLPGSIERAANELSAAGHEVVRCHAEDDPPFPCFALQDGQRCPLEGDPVDVVLAARNRPWPRPTRLEDGALCAIRRHVPLVVTDPVFNPFEKWTTRVATPGAVPEACEQAADAPLDPHGEIAATAATAMLERAGADASRVSATVHRQRGRLRVQLELPSEALEIGADVVPNVLAALRAYDRHATGIDISVDAVD